ncbi:hypothetical protein GCM10011320_56930 [Neoroseomonas lacus]|uniref:Universal stress protein n=1 Tax=Neoroseomonas lacus TaxID=287609 RepID=A0A917L319_9PROT|nr:hypothetical protein GCM10011320_56930 [Neoroseomonas lacus]
MPAGARVMSGEARGIDRHRRLLLDLCHIGEDPRAISTVAELAGLLDLDLLGIFVEDEAVCSLASLPFARELCLPVHEWSPLAIRRIEGEFQAASSRLRTMLDAHAARLGVANRIEVLRGDPAAAVAALSGETDIMVLGASGSAAAHMLGTFPRAWRAAIESPAAVLLLPSRIAHRTGPVAVLVKAGAGHKFALAARIAKATGEKLILLRSVHTEAGSVDALADVARAIGIAEDQVIVREAGDASTATLQILMARTGGRLLALDRPSVEDASPDVARQLSQALRIPVLLQ